jgi:hypothetical protein
MSIGFLDEQIGSIQEQGEDVYNKLYKSNLVEKASKSNTDAINLTDGDIDFNVGAVMHCMMNLQLLVSNMLSFNKEDIKSSDLISEVVNLFTAAF